MTSRTGNLTGFRSTVFIGLGSNLDNPVAQVQQAMLEVDEIADSALVKISSFYESAPVVDHDGNRDQPAYINAVAELTTTLSPQELMQALLAIESRHQRVRSEKSAPRTLDLDILIFNEWRIDSPELTTPHPRAHERAFVLHPLIEIAPDVYIPGKGYARDFLAGVAGQAIRRLHDADA